MTYGGYPGNNGPWFTDWLVYGHLAVSVFIVVSGFSLSLSPAAHHLRLRNGGHDFLRRRFWRIVPPYWAALTISALLITAGIIGSPAGSAITGQDILIHALLLQDAVGSNSPNGVFWSIAVEWHIYFVFPLLLLFMRKFGVMTILPFVVVLVGVQHTAGQFIPLLGAFDRFSTAYLALFAAGVTAAWLSHHRRGVRFCVVSAIMLGSGFVVAAAVIGPRWIVSQYFWVDLVVGGASAAMMTALDQGSLRWLTRLLSARPLVFVGQFAFSLYLIHAPVLEVLRVHLVVPTGLTGAPAFWMLAAIGIPAALGTAYLFFRTCERPFLTIRSFHELAAAVREWFRRSSDYAFRSLRDSRTPRRRTQ
jgi:peptidoglycan/LPS O-acetylase OafA/YrhL